MATALPIIFARQTIQRHLLVIRIRFRMMPMTAAMVLSLPIQGAIAQGMDKRGILERLRPIRPERPIIPYLQHQHVARWVRIATQHLHVAIRQPSIAHRREVLLQQFLCLHLNLM